MRLSRLKRERKVWNRRPALQGRDLSAQGLSLIHISARADEELLVSGPGEDAGNDPHDADRSGENDSSPAGGNVRGGHMPEYLSLIHI